MELHDFLAAFEARTKTDGLRGDDFAPLMRGVMRELAACWDDPRVQALANFDFEQDKTAIAAWFESFFRRKGYPPPETRTIMLWFIGSGPDYPIGMTAFSQTPAPVVDYWVDDEERFRKGLWGSAQDDEDYCLAPFPGFLHAALIGRGDHPSITYELEFAIMYYYAHLSVSWIANHLRHVWLRASPEIYFVFGVTENSDQIIAGRISTDHGWQPVTELISRNQTRIT